jgi:hypothetical protein
MCKHRTVPRAPAALAVQLPAFGEKGFMKLQYTGIDAHTVYGEITDHPYRWDKQRIQFVDRRDAVFMLGVEYMPC